MGEPSHDPRKTGGETPEITGSFPVVTDSIRAFVALCERGIDRRDEIVGWHGTSVEAMNQALRLGALPPSRVAHAGASAGHLFFFPPEEGDDSSGRALSLQRCGRGGAMRYAEGNAQHHYLYEALGLDPLNVSNRDRIFEAVDAFTSNPRSAATRASFAKLGLGQEKLSEVLTELPRRKGFLVALGRSALERYEVSHGDVPGEDKKICVPAGLPLGDIEGIDPLGDVEFEFFERLQAAVRGGGS